MARTFEIKTTMIRPGDSVDIHVDNYWRKVQALANAGIITADTPFIVEHDDWCLWYRGQEVPCNCDPNVKTPNGTPLVPPTNDWKRREMKDGEVYIPNPRDRQH